MKLARVGSLLFLVSSALVLLVCATLNATGQSRSRSHTPAAKTSVSTAKDPVKPVALAVQNPIYHIGAGDVLNVNVWKEPEVSQKLPVRPDGMISLPLIGDVEAAGQTPQSLAETISQKLKTYIQSPQVTVIVVEVQSKSFVVMGQVVHPGKYPLTRPTTLMEALSVAGGFQEFAKTGKIYLLRQIAGKMWRYPFNYGKVIKGKDHNEDIEVQDGDVIVVP